MQRGVLRHARVSPPVSGLRGSLEVSKLKSRFFYIFLMVL